MADFELVALEYLQGKALEWIEKGFRTQVIERWTRSRATAYFDELCRAVAEAASVENEAQLQSVLDQLLENESSSEVLFEAYRSVCFTRSKEIGPRILAVLTADIVMDKRDPDWSDNAIFWCAENFDDQEFNEVVEFFDKQTKLAKEMPEKLKRRWNTDIVEMGPSNNSLSIRWAVEQIDSNWKTLNSVSVSPLNLGEHLGPWAEKLFARGLLTNDVKERVWDYEEDCEAFAAAPGTVREISWWLGFGPASFRLCDLIRKVGREDNSQRE